LIFLFLFLLTIICFGPAQKNIAARVCACFPVLPRGDTGACFLAHG
jgi:hypothetical protein